MDYCTSIQRAPSSSGIAAMVHADGSGEVMTAYTEWKRDDVILDPFSGSGTTARVAAEMGASASGSTSRAETRR